jgi:hypothetical protein
MTLAAVAAMLGVVFHCGRAAIDCSDTHHNYQNDNQQKNPTRNRHCVKRVCHPIPPSNNPTKENNAFGAS